MYRILAFIIATLMALGSSAQATKNTKKRLGSYFDSYQNTAYNCKDKTKVEKLYFRSQHKEVEIVVSEIFLGQPFTNELVKNIYNDIRQYIPAPYNKWNIKITVNGYPIEQLVPANTLPEADTTRFWGTVEHKDLPWTTILSKPYSVTNGLQDRHMAVWASHGRYYNFKTDAWRWQRPNLFNTCEDILTPSIVVPMLMPMLENAGAIVFSPRERDTQIHEVIVDNDRPTINGAYREDNGANEWVDCGTGFAHWREFYRDTQNPFEEGTARVTNTQTSNQKASTITWVPNIPQDGKYAVYVSYKTLPTSVPDAVYTIVHQGVETKVRVNQRMGGGTWVYLGTYDFHQGQSYDCCVSLSNHSDFHGHITADAVRFGGGMGNIERGEIGEEYQKISGLPRYLEGSRYYMHWAGAPYSVYSSKEGTNDYADDINARSYGLNHVARGSVYMPNDTLPGLNVPLELALGVHTDAGLRPNMDIIGTLGVYTTQFYDKKLATGLSRLASRDLADGMLSELHKDLTFHLGSWNRRSLYDRNYSESREPQIPSMILELLSHQNYADMLVAHDPYCKFIIARSIYKSILKNNAMIHQRKAPVVQPLPVRDLAAVTNTSNKQITLSWTPQTDPLEESAMPNSYILYIKQNDRGWDNGTIVTGTQVNINATPGIMYRFKVAALNEGGSSMPSEEVCARVAYDNNALSIMIVNGFERIAAPQAIDNDTLRGFDIKQDPGVAYISNTSIYDLNGMPIAGNTFDYASMHAADFLIADKDFSARRDLSISSCIVSALPKIDLKPYAMVDLILGAQRMDGYSHRVYQAYPEYVQNSITEYTKNGGNVMVSGAYVGEDLITSEQRDFAYNILKYIHHDNVKTDSLQIKGMGTEFNIISQPNPYIYTTARVNAIHPTEGAFTTLLFNETYTTYLTDETNGGTDTEVQIPQVSIKQTSGAVAYQGNDYRCITFGFPLELIENTEIRRAIFNASLQFLCTE